MKYSLLKYYFAILGVTVFLALFLMPELRWHYLSFGLLNVVTFYALSEKRYFQIPALFIFGTFFLAYYVRPFILTFHPEFYMYDKVFPIRDLAVMVSASNSVLSHILPFLAGFLLFAVFRSPKRYYLSDNKTNEFFYNKNQIFLVLFVFLIVKLFLHLGLGVGLKGVKNTSSLAFLLRLIPRDLPFIVIALFFLKYRKDLNLVYSVLLWVLLIGFVISVLVTGSKTFIMIFGLVYITYLLYTNKKIILSRFILLVAVVALILPLSFISSLVIKSGIKSNNLSISTVIEASSYYYNTIDQAILIDQVTRRMAGFDGQIAAEIFSNEQNTNNFEQLQKSFLPKEVFLKIVEGMVPFVDIAKTPSLGVSVGYFVLQFDPDSSSFAGALGFFPSIKLIAQNKMLLNIFILFLFGALISIYFSKIRNIQNSDLHFILFYSGCYLIMHTLLSGNLDTLFATFFTKLAMIFIYLGIVIGIRSTVKRSL